MMDMHLVYILFLLVCQIEKGRNDADDCIIVRIVVMNLQGLEIYLLLIWSVRLCVTNTVFG